MQHGTYEKGNNGPKTRGMALTHIITTIPSSLILATEFMFEDYSSKQTLQMAHFRFKLIISL